MNPIHYRIQVYIFLKLFFNQMLYFPIPRNFLKQDIVLVLGVHYIYVAQRFITSADTNDLGYIGLGLNINL